jgi:hypothetical protein
MPSNTSLSAWCASKDTNTYKVYPTWNASAISTPLQLSDILRVDALWYDSELQQKLSQCADDETPWPNAATCTLSWCKQRVKSQVNNGSLTEQVVSSENLVFPHEELQCNASFSWERFTLPAFSKGYLPADNDLCAHRFAHNDSVYWINLRDSEDMTSMATTILAPRGIISQETIGVLTQETITSGVLLNSVNGGNISADFPGIAASMSRYVRQSPNSTLHEGTAWTTETYVRVRWMWLLYPIILTLFGIAFLGISMWQSGRKTRVVWKSSSLALLFQGFTGYEQDVHGRETSDMKRAAKRMRVQLKDDDKGNIVLNT